MNNDGNLFQTLCKLQLASGGSAESIGAITSFMYLKIFVKFCLHSISVPVLCS